MRLKHSSYQTDTVQTSRTRSLHRCWFLSKETFYLQSNCLAWLAIRRAAREVTELCWFCLDKGSMYVCLPYCLLCQHCHQHQHPHLHQDLDDLHLGLDRLRAETALRLEDEGICGKNAGDHSTLQSFFNNQNQQHRDWRMRVSDDQHYGCSHEHLYIVVIKFNQPLLQQTKDTCWRNWRVGPATRWSSISKSTSTKFSSTSTSMPTSKWKLPFSYPSPLPNH